MGEGRALETARGVEEVSSLEEDSSRRGLGRERSESVALLWGRGEKLPGALGGGLAGCIGMEFVRGLLHL